MSKYILVTMRNGSVWKVPADIVAKNRAKYYADREHRLTPGKPRWQEIYETEYEMTLMYPDELLDWAANNMNWEDVAWSALEVPAPRQILTPLEWQEGWANGPKRIVEEE